MIRATMKRVFLSHAGEDHEIAKWFADRLRQHLSQAKLTTEVFNTSEPEYRLFKATEELFFATPQTGTDYLAKRAVEVQEYLEKNLGQAVVYLLLVTRRSLRKQSAWIAFEMVCASKRAIAFVPCLCEGVTLLDIEEAEARDRLLRSTRADANPLFTDRHGCPWWSLENHLMASVTTEADVANLARHVIEIIKHDAEAGETPDGICCSG